MGLKRQKEQLAIKLESVSKQYLLYHQKPTFIENLLNLERKEKFWALKDISLEIRAGDKIGIIGNNGAGKTTLLKAISGISTPTSGKVYTNGRLVSLIDLNAGFHPDLTGYENVFLNSLLLGMSKEEVKSKLSQIISFADIGKFIDAPFYTYSTGMRLRLGFSICIHTEADIFIFDEGIYAGDKDFREKTYDKLKELFTKRQVTLLVTSHVFEFLNDFCEKFIWMEKGSARRYGPFKSTLKLYQETSSEKK